MNTKIIQKLKNLEQVHNIKVLFAIESGSRTWGFASEDSDWDVRFVYVRPIQWYLRPTKKKIADTISWMSDDHIWDVVGWDLKKALYHINRSNPSITEWLHSKIVYVNVDGAREVLLHLLDRASCLQSYLYHYRSMAKRNWKNHFAGKENGKLKKYFYIIRPIVMFILIINEQKMYNTINFEEVLAQCQKYIPTEVYEQITKLLRIKRNKSSEQDLIGSFQAMNVWIENWIRKDIQPTEKRNVSVDELSQYLYSFSRTYFPEINTLVEPCRYSFQDLLRASGKTEDTKRMNAMSQARRNNEIKILCTEAGWYWHDVTKNGQIFTAFSPQCSNI